MSEKRFTLEQWTKHSLYYSDGEYSAHMSIGFICEKVEKKLNEQQAEIDDLNQENEQLKQKLENIGLNEKNDMVKMIDGKVFIRM